MIGGILPKKIIQKYDSPLYVYDSEMIQEKCRILKKNFPKINFFYACKANTNPEILRLIKKQGVGIETVSPGEISVAKKVGVPVSKITFTCGSISEEELIWVAKQKIRIHLDSLRQVEIFGKHFPGEEISVRLNQGIGAGHHSHVITGGQESKFGINLADVGKLEKLAKKYNLRIIGLHQHIGSNILDVSIFMKAVNVLCNTAMNFPDLKHLDFGGGFGIPYKPEEKKFDIELLGKKVMARISAFTKEYGHSLEISFEPGRYLVAESGSLLVTVNDIKHNLTKIFIGVDSGFNHLIRPVMYDSYHEIINTNKNRKRKGKVTVVGNICESGDIFAKDRRIYFPEYGDILLIKNVGAYGYVMSSNYNSRHRPREILILNKKLKVV